LFVSGSSGFAPSIAPQAYTRAAESWLSRGYVVVFVDYLAARHLANCPNSAMLTLVEIGKDILAAASYLRTQPFMIPTRITAVGWSLGGGGVLAALGQINSGRDQPAAFAYRLLSLLPRPAAVACDGSGAEPHGGRRWDCAAGTVSAGLRTVAAGTPIEARTYPEARHGFDTQEPPPFARFGNEIVGYNAAAAEAASRDIDKFMNKYP
jgi:dienelactone hydrolase